MTSKSSNLDTDTIAKILDDVYQIGKTDAIMENSHDDWPILRPNVISKMTTLFTQECIRAEITELNYVRQSFVSYDWGVFDPLSIIDKRLSALTKSLERGEDDKS